MGIFQKGLNAIKQIRRTITDGRIPLIPSYFVGQPLWQDWNSKKAIKDGMETSTWVYACVKKRAENIASVPWIVEKQTSDNEWERVEDHELENLIANPSPNFASHINGKDMMKLLVYYLDLTGNNIWHKNIVDGKIKELWPLRPDRIQVIPADLRATGELIDYYKYRIGGEVFYLEPETIAHFMYVNPSDLYWGLSPLKAGSHIIDTDIAAMEWNKYAMDNRAASDGILSFKEPLTEKQFNETKEQLREQKQGPKNAHDIWLIGGDAQFAELSKSAQEMDFVESRKANMREICSLFNMDPLVLGAPDPASRANKKEAYKDFWENSLLPTLDALQESFNNTLTPHWDNSGNLRLRYDISNVAALQQNLNDKVVVADKLYRMGIPLDQINDRLELGFEDLPSQTRLQQVSQRVIVEEEEEKSQFNKETIDSEFGKDIAGLNPVYLGDPKNYRYWKSMDKQKQSFEKLVEEEIIKVFEDEQERVSKFIENNPNITSLANFIDDEITRDWEDILSAIYNQVITHFAEREIETLVEEVENKGLKTFKTKDFELNRSFVQTFISKHALNQAQNITNATKTKLTRVLREGIADELGSNEIARNMRDVYDHWENPEELDVSRANKIARTEVHSSSQYGHFAGAKQAEEELDIRQTKTWLDSGDDRVRESHEEVHGETIGLDDYYNNGLLYPGDPDGEAREIINCRCTEKHDIVEVN